ncbi:P-loop containing nucleoside triphosphate hydrolase protein [Mycena crocata]|nr:P-loop containing nucleoside triphosphate hydrolase protein [Mycena crocata]
MAEALTSTDQKGWIDRHGAKRTVPMKVLVLGFPRTGTSSMLAALELLGYINVHHMTCVFANPPEADMWTEAINAKFFGNGKPYGRAEWDQLLGHCEAVTDAPSVVFAEELVAAYPDAKVILTNRSPDKWWLSFDGSLGKIFRNPLFGIAAALDPDALGRVVNLCRLVLVVLLGRGFTPEGAQQRFVDHYARLRSVVPAERLLEYEVSEGWGPLCEFLGKDVPAVDFPRANDTKVMIARSQATISAIFRRFAVRVVLPAVLMTGVGFAIYARGSGSFRR